MQAGASAIDTILVDGLYRQTAFCGQLLRRARPQRVTQALVDIAYLRPANRYVCPELARSLIEQEVVGRIATRMHQAYEHVHTGAIAGLEILDVEKT